MNIFEKAVLEVQEQREHENQEAIDRKSEWLHHECTSKLRSSLEERRSMTLTRLLSVARDSSDPAVREYACRLHELENLIVETGLKKLGERK